jgi:hypothetical protein
MTHPDEAAEGYYKRPFFRGSAIRALAGPRFDALRLNFTQWSVVDESVLLYAEQILELAHANPELFQGAVMDTLWPQFIACFLDNYPDDGRHNPPHPIGWRSRTDEPHNPFGLKPDEVGARIKISGGEKRLQFMSMPDGPGCLIIKARDHKLSRIHPVLLDLSAAWIWGFATLHEASLAAADWWIAAGVLTNAARTAIDNDGQHKVTRVDVCVDHQCLDGEWNHKDSNPAKWRTRSRSVGGKHPPVDVLSKYGLTISVGQRGGAGIFLRIYDKTAELGERIETAVAPKVWAKNGWNREMRVWRCEFEFGGAVLKSICRADRTGASLRALDAFDLWTEGMDRFRHIEPEQPSKPTARWMELTLVGLGTQPYLRSAKERRRSELEIAKRQFAKALNRYVDAGADDEMVQFIIDERGMRD